MTPCRAWNAELLDCALGRPLTQKLSAHLAVCPQCDGALQAWRAKAWQMDGVLTRLSASEPRRDGPERVLARIATMAPATAPFYARLVAAAAVLVILAGQIALTGRPVRTTSLSTWRSPTQSLLRCPADSLLKGVPRLGDGLFELHAGKEEYAQ